MRSSPVAAVRVTVRHADPLTRAGIAHTLAGVAALTLVDEAPQVLVADYDSALAALSADSAEAADRDAGRPRVLVVSPRDTEAEIRHALARGAQGFLTPCCGADELVEAVLSLHRGQQALGARAARRLADAQHAAGLTPRELDVLRRIAAGLGNKGIARDLDIALGTVKTHTRAILAKLDVATRTEATVIARERGLLLGLST